MNTYIYTNKSAPGIEIKIVAKDERHAERQRTNLIENNKHWLRFEVTDLWEITNQWSG